MHPPSARKSIWKTVATVVAEILLVVLTLAMIGATLLPVFKGASPDAGERGYPGAPARRR
jgi:hypothetical protein